MGQDEQTPKIKIGCKQAPGIYLGTKANFTDLDKKNIDENTKARHTHDNKEILDGITQEDIDNWDEKYTKEEIDTKLTEKENVANKADSGVPDEFWWDYYLEHEKYPSMAVVSNGFIHLIFNKIDPLGEQVNNLSESKQDKLTIDSEVTYNSTNPVTSKAVYDHVYPTWVKAETVEYELNNLKPVIKQAHIARAFENYEALIDFYDETMYNPIFMEEIGGGAASQGFYTPIGSSMYIKTKDVPDLWVMDRIIETTESDNPPTPFCADIKADAKAAGMSLDEYIIHKIDTEGEFSIKWLKFVPKETEKVDLVNYPTKDEVIPIPKTANVGQVIVVKEVDENGKPTAWEAVDMQGGTSKDWELAASYVHEGNRVIQPTALDKETGYFTCENHGLTEGDSLITCENSNYYNQLISYIPYELYQKANYKTDRLFIRLKTVTVIDENTFALTKSDGTIYTYTASQNGYVDATKFYFETTDGGVFTGFTNLDIDMRNYDVKIVARNPHMRINFKINDFTNYYTLVNPHGHDGGIGMGAYITPIYGAYSNGEALWTYENEILFNNSKSVTRWAVQKTPMTTNYIAESYMNNVLASDSDNTSFAENPIINKLTLNMYYTDQYFRNGGTVEIWKKQK